MIAVKHAKYSLAFAHHVQKTIPLTSPNASIIGRSVSRQNSMKIIRLSQLILSFKPSSERLVKFCQLRKILSSLTPSMLGPPLLRALFPLNPSHRPSKHKPYSNRMSITQVLGLSAAPSTSTTTINSLLMMKEHQGLIQG